MSGRLTEEDARHARRWLEQQAALRELIWRSLEAYPKSGLYEDEVADGENEAEALRQFQGLLRHVRATVKTSPRSQALEELSRRFASPAFAELRAELGLEGEVAAAAVAEAVASVPKGRSYSQFLAAKAASEKPSQVMVKEEEIREGLRKRGLAKGQPPCEEELNQQLRALAAKEEERRLEHRLRAEELKKELEVDPRHLRWGRVQNLWEASGARDLWEGYEVLDRAQGHDRRWHGDAFEAKEMRLAAALALEALKESHGLPEGEFGFLRGCEWVDQKQRVCGEIDVAIVALGSGGAEICDGRVVALVEMKSGWFELPAALLLQHVAKWCAAKGEGTLRICWGQRALALEAQPRIFAATLIPSHPFVMGLDPELLKTVCKALFAGVEEEDLGACQRLWVELRADARLRPRLALSPQALLRHPELHHHVLVLGSEAAKASGL
ncbi:unnamed protein product [Effrenium voratum]|uniref:Uncharacterized protein n=1 Tax=Effrenium voratum TaxID=2562239 RepID=A0AA36NHI3_9DINO|nr:unnamed protein product [Effrenium voratum]CAJ1446722.1 unnamed protein product [Effrenium voratum]